ncbi:MAG: rod shape-determining protein MreD [Endomicrobium sp.]|jgi:rod shape-determining protein MreD|nr:rod shape-determining protein MreD [Endomicrobium sp.]
MRKFIFYLYIYIVFCLLQFFFSQYLNIFEIYPNFILIFVVCAGLLRGSLNAQLAGFVFGITWDIFSTDVFATRALLFTILGYCSGKLRKNFDEDSIIFQSAIIFVASLVYSLGVYLINCSVIQYILVYNFNVVLIKNIFQILINVAAALCVFYVLKRYFKEV